MHGARRDFRIRRIGMVFQDFELVEMIRRCSTTSCSPTGSADHRGSVEAIRERAIELAGGVGLGDKIHRLSSNCRTAKSNESPCAGCSTAKPVVLLADEPTGNFDPECPARARHPARRG